MSHPKPSIIKYTFKIDISRVILLLSVAYSFRHYGELWLRVFILLWFCGFGRCIFREVGAKRMPPFSVSSSDTRISTWEATRSYVSEHRIKNFHRCSKLDQFLSEEDAMKLHEKKFTSCIYSMQYSFLCLIHFIPNTITSYVLNMFRTLIYPLSGACDYSVELPHWSYCSWFDVLWSFGVVGLEWYPCCRLKEALVHETATYRFDDTRSCVMQFWPPDDEHVCSKHVEAWNKRIVKQNFCASRWLITEINTTTCFGPVCRPSSGCPRLFKELIDYTG